LGRDRAPDIKKLTSEVRKYGQDLCGHAFLAARISLGNHLIPTAFPMEVVMGSDSTLYGTSDGSSANAGDHLDFESGRHMVRPCGRIPPWMNLASSGSGKSHSRFFALSSAAF
jgi:hypothetical protein